MRDKPGERCVRSKVRPTRLALFFLLCPERIVKEKERGRRRRCGIKSNKIRITMWLEKRKKKKGSGFDGGGAQRKPSPLQSWGRSRSDKQIRVFFFYFIVLKGKKRCGTYMFPGCAGWAAVLKSGTGSVWGALSGWQMDVDVPLFSCAPSLPSGTLCFWLSWRVPAYIAPGVGNAGSYLLAETRLPPLARFDSAKIIKTPLLVFSSDFSNGDVRHLQAITSAWRCQGPCSNDGVINSRLD